MISRRSLCASMAVLPLVGCTTDKNIYEPKSLDNNIYEPKAVITDENYLKVMGANPKASIIAQGFQWCEGPVWDIKRDCLYFTDVPQNKAFRWDKTSDAETFLYPSGAEGVEGFREPGANGLFYDKSAKILLCNHGRRAVERLDPDTGTRELLIGAYKGKKFNSPNDIVISKTGHIFFTDPPYGLEGLDQSPLKELEFNGVYHLTPEGDVRLIDTSLSFPNGIALSPDETSLYVNQSDPNLPIMKRYKFGEAEFTY